MPRPLRVSTSYVRLLYDFLDQRGLDAAATLGREAPPEDPTGRSWVLVEELSRLFERAAQVVHEPALGMQVGALIQPAHVGLVGYLLMNCRTLAQAMYRHNEFERLYWDGINGRIRPELRGVRISWPEEGQDISPLLTECNLAAILTFSRNICARPDRNPIDVHFSGPRPSDLRPYEDFFRCPVHFEAKVVSISVSYQDLLLPVRGPDESLYKLLEVQARERAEQLPISDPLVAQLSSTIAALLTVGEATLAEAADRMGCTARTLQRRLEETGTSFQAVLDSTRQALSESYLRDRGLHIAELAQLLGYADQASFTRAFKRWKGVSPARWRKQALTDT